MQFNEQQQAVINAIDGVWVAIAGPGSGKTACMVERRIKMAELGIPNSDILNLTFTNAAASEAAKRVGIADPEKVFRTFHSFALELIRKERAHLPFKLTESVIPVRGEDYQLLFDLVKQFPAIPSFRSLQSKISEWKRSNVEPSQAMDESKGTEYYYALAYDAYERRCRLDGWLDFDSLMRETVKLLETNEDVRKRHQRKYLSVDEGQDCDKIQFRLLQLLFSGNILVVGDENQCQPKGTIISCERGELPIELLRKGDRVRYWNRVSGHVPTTRFSSVEVSSRGYLGELISVRCGKKVTRMTPDHLVYATLNIKQPFEYLVYLMWRKDLGFRIGQVRTAAGKGTRRGIGGFTSRCYEENADRAWILKACRTKEEARTHEAIEAAKFGIPTCVFTSQSHHLLKNENLKNIFSSVPQDHGFVCLKEHGLLFDGPLFGIENPHQRYFKTQAANLISGVFSLPSTTPFSPQPIDEIRREFYEGKVYSLNVKKYHTYIADGIPVGNCIYEWRSAHADSLSNFHRSFPGAKVLYLGQNYRSAKKLVQFYKEILPVDNGLASHMKTDNEEGTDPVLIHYPDSDIEVRQVLDQAHQDPENSVIIARTNRKLFEVQRIAASKGIKYRNLGKKDFWEQNEIKALFTLARESSPFQNAASGLKDIIRDHNMYNRYRHSDSMYSDPIENLNNMVKLAAVKNLPMVQFLEYIRRLTYGRKSRKEKDLMLATVHQAKGREWKNVFVIDASQGMMPHQNGEIAEEKRIFFVACSRAAEKLQISWSGNQSMFLEGRQYINYRVEVEDVFPEDSTEV